jgi:hypothetical protein
MYRNHAALIAATGTWPSVVEGVEHAQPRDVIAHEQQVDSVCRDDVPDVFDLAEPPLGFVFIHRRIAEPADNAVAPLLRQGELVGQALRRRSRSGDRYAQRSSRHDPVVDGEVREETGCPRREEEQSEVVHRRRRHAEDGVKYGKGRRSQARGDRGECDGARERRRERQGHRATREPRARQEHDSREERETGSVAGPGKPNLGDQADGRGRDR